MDPSTQRAGTFILTIHLIILLIIVTLSHNSASQVGWVAFLLGLVTFSLTIVCFSLTACRFVK